MAESDFRDDTTIPGSEILLRRIHPEQIDDNPAELPTSAAFENGNDESGNKTSMMSVALLSVLKNNGLEPENLLQGYDGWGLVSLKADDFREESQKIVRDPTPEEPWHAHVVGTKGKSRRRRLRNKSLWVVNPNG